MKSKDIIKILESDGWVKHTQKGSHCQFKHPFKKGKDPKSDLPIKTIQSILKQAGLK
jgi:predicted RNA binding protein YcfA (HicA-like mRNA interferase family)